MAKRGSHVNVADVIRILVVDDHALFRDGLVRALKAEPDLEIVGESPDGLDAIERAADLQPDVILMDVRMPGATGIEATRRIRSAQPSTKIVMLTVSDDDEDLFASIRAGAIGYMLKDASVEEIAGAVRAATAGQSVISPPMAARLVAEFNILSGRLEAEHDRHRLTARELEVLRLIARGLSNKDIASELVIAENTVRNHVRNILEKLQVRSRVEAAMYAVREKLVDTG